MRRFTIAVALLCLTGALSLRAQDTPPPFEIITAENADRVEQVGMIGYGEVEDMAWSPDGETLAVAGSLGLIFYDAELYERAPSTRWELPEQVVISVAYSPDGSLLATLSVDLFPSDNYMIRLLDVSTGQTLAEWAYTWRSQLEFSPDGTELAVFNPRDNTDSSRWNISNPQNIVALPDQTWSETQRNWISPDSTAVVPDSVGSVSYSPDGHYVAYAFNYGSVQVMDTQSGEETLSFSAEPYGTSELYFLADSAHLVSLGYTEMGGGDIHILDVTSGDEVLHEIKGGVRGLGVRPTTSTLVFHPYFGSGIYFWQAGMESSEAIFGQDVLWQANKYSDLEFNPSGDVLAVIHGGAVEFWNVLNGVKVGDDLYIAPTIDEEDTGYFTYFAFTAMSYSPDGRYLALSSRNVNGDPIDYLMWLYDSQTLDLLATFNIEHPYDLEFSPDGQYLATYHTIQSDIAPNIAYLWDVEALLQVFDTDPESVSRIWHVNLLGLVEFIGLAFSLDGQELAISGLGTEVYSVERLIALGEVGVDQAARDSDALTNIFQGRGTFAYSPDGQLIALHSNTQECYIVIWNVDNSDDLETCVGDNLLRENDSRAIGFSSDGSLLFTGAQFPFYSNDTYSLDIRLWDVETGELLTALEGHFETYNDILMSPDGRLMVSAGGGVRDNCYQCPSYDGSLRIWGIPSTE